jgi:hypothetical protein
VQNERRRETPTQVLNEGERPHGDTSSTHGEHNGLYFDLRYNRQIAAHFEVGVFAKIKTSAQITKEEGGFVGDDVYQLRVKFVAVVRVVLVVFDTQ